MENILEVKNVSVEFKKNKKPFFAVKDVSFEIHKGEILGLAGESGALRSTTPLLPERKSMSLTIFSSLFSPNSTCRYLRLWRT